MRLIGTLSSEMRAKRFSSYLQQKGVQSHCEMVFDAATGQMSYQMWIPDEDKVQEAAALFDHFEKDPADVEFDAAIPLQIDEEAVAFEKEQSKEIIRGRKTPLTLLLLALCCCVFLLNGFQELSMRREGLPSGLLLTPVQSAFLYDVPPAFEALDQLIRRHPEMLSTQASQQLEADVEVELRKIEKIPYWRGLYDWLILKATQGDASLAEGPLLVHIRQGEVWRLFSPCLMHSELLHILFNLLWLWMLGRPIEQRIGIWKTAALTLIAGVGSNTAQYFIGGPFFIGYSGIVLALAGFTWMRQRVAPWEGYLLNRTTTLFLALFVLSMFALTFISFILQLFTNVVFAPNIANTAHVVGGFFGLLFGRFSCFSWNARIAKGEE